jgi:hypothetical protein
MRIELEPPWRNRQKALNLCDVQSIEEKKCIFQICRKVMQDAQSYISPPKRIKPDQ